MAGSLGYRTEVWLEEENSSDRVARIRVIEDLVQSDTLAAYIEARCSNRKPYKTAPLTKEEANYLLSSQDFPPGINVFLKTGVAKDSLAVSASVNEKILLENRLLHKFLFDHITWSAIEDEQKHGFYIETLELSDFHKFGLRLFRYWPILQILNRVGVSQSISVANAELYKKSAAIGAIFVSNDSRADFINAGIVLEKVWLRATKLKLGFQPLTGITLLMKRLCIEHSDLLSRTHLDVIRHAYKRIKNIYRNEEDRILMLFRVGHSTGPSGRTGRRPPALVRI